MAGLVFRSTRLEEEKQREDMKLAWSPETASKAYIDTVKSCELWGESGVAELISAMAAGWNAKLIVETWSSGGAMATSIGLGVARRHTGGRHVCVVPDDASRAEYAAASEKAGMWVEVVVVEEGMGLGGVEGVDFLVVDCRRDDFARVLREAKIGNRGAVMVCKNASSRSASEFRWRGVVGDGSRIVRSVFLPVGKGLDMAHVAAAGASSAAKTQSRWLRHIDQRSGEEYVIRR